MDRNQYTALDQRLAGVERETAALRMELTRLAQGTPAVAPAYAVPPAVAPRQAPPPTPAPVLGQRNSMEAFFTGRGLQLAGVLLVLLGTAFFLNLAFSRGWIGPAERILLGLIAGSALLAIGARRHQRGNMPIAEGVIALGSGILYLSLWAAVAAFPELHVSRAAAFVAMIAVTATLAAIASARRSERIALLGLAGGFITPLLLSSATPDRPVLAGYLFVLGIGFAALGVMMRFRFVEATAFVASAIYLPVFAPVDAAWPTAVACAVLAAFCTAFGAAFTLGTLRDPAHGNFRIALLCADAAVLIGLLAWIFHGRQTTLGIAYLTVAATLLLAARILPVPRSTAVAYGYLGLAAVTCALPALLHRLTLLDALAVEGAIVVALAARRADARLAAAGAALLGCVCLWLIGETLSAPPAGTPFSSLALSFAIVVAALASARTRLGGLPLAPGTCAGWATAGSVLGSIVGVIGVSRILLDGLGGPHWDQSTPSYTQFALSFAWTAYATTLFGLGMKRGSASLRRQGLVLVALTVLKVFTIDLSYVDVSWRIASFVVLGIVCLAMSAWYMRVQAAARQAQA